MGVHVGELHTDVVPGDQAANHGADAGAATPPWTADHQWLESAERAAWLRSRVSADGFDD